MRKNSLNNGKMLDFLILFATRVKTYFNPFFRGFHTKNNESIYSLFLNLKNTLKKSQFYYVFLF